MTTEPGESTATQAEAYARQLTIQASRERVFDAIGTLDGPRHWWTTIVTGSAAAGGRSLTGGTTSWPASPPMRSGAWAARSGHDKPPVCLTATRR